MFKVPLQFRNERQRHSGPASACLPYHALSATQQVVVGMIPALLIGGLPKFLWWKATPDPNNGIFKRLAAVCNSVARCPRHYICSADCLGFADRQVAPSGVIDPLRTSPEILPGLLAYVSGMLVLPPQVGVSGGVRPSAPAAAPSGGGPGRRTAERAGCYPPHLVAPYQVPPWESSKDLI